MLWILTLALTAALVLERITYAFVTVLFFILGVGSDRKSTLFVSSFTMSAMSFTSSCINAFGRLLSITLRGIAWCVLFFVVWAIVYMAARHSGPALIALQSSYNSSIGGMVQLYLVYPMQLVGYVWDGVIPIWNAIVYNLKTVPTRVLLENVVQGVGDIESSATHLALFIRALVFSLLKYVNVLIYPPDSFDPNLRILDLLTPLAEWRLAVSYLLVWTGRLCSVASSVLDLAVYPLLDINFGLAVHNIGNSILYLFIHVPAVTVDRCSAGGGLAAYCLPDFEPVFTLLVAGLRNAGLLVDNWLDVGLLVIQSVLTGSQPPCVGADIIAAGALVIGSNESIVVGVEPGLLVRTDGWNIAQIDRSGLEHEVFEFPFAVRVDYGVAVVSASVENKGIMGCACNDRAYGLQIICVVVPLDSHASAFYVPVEFQVPSTSFFMSCATSKIKLESIRWPVTRYTAPSSGNNQGGVAEAALWVRPFCGADTISVACIETFALAGCFPYCMALWTRGYTSGSMVLRSADEWQSTVAMVSRDCGLHSWDLISGDIGAVTERLRSNSGVKTTWMDAEVQLNSSHCVYSPTAVSRMLRNATQGAYASFSSVDLSNQPFAFAGDLVFTAVLLVGDSWGIQVQRIFGNQVRSFICSVIACRNLLMSSSSSGPHCCISVMHVESCSSCICLRFLSRSAA